ncbi:MAG: acetate--CoA ligase family protein [Candidatus Margulisiibacteriota bacterium]|jgi:acetyltransferase
MENCDINALFKPKSIAIVGASDKPGKIGFSIVDNIVAGGYKGKIYPVNPKGGNILGHKVYTSVSEIPEKEIDIVCISIPADKVYTCVEDCAKKKVKFLVIITSGFSEIGNNEEEERILKLAQTHNMRIVGPNMFGIYTKAVSLNATFGPKNIKPGHVAILTQSGALGIGMIGKTAAMGLGLSAIVSMGNKLDIDETDILDYLVDDEDTKVIIMYMEGVKNGIKLIEVLKRVTKRKNVIVIKSGRSTRGAIATASHTGSLAGEDAIFDAVMKQCGVIRAETIKEALEWGRWSQFLLDISLPKGDNGIIITNGGGLGVLATDACEKYHVNLYDNQKEMKHAFESVVSSFGSTKNPIDLTGQATAADYRKSLDVAIKDPDIHVIIALYCETAVFDQNELVEVIEEKCYEAKLNNKPLVFSLFGGAKLEEIIEKLTNKGIPVFADVYDAIAGLSALYTLKRNILKDIEKIEETPMDYDAINAIIANARNQGRYFLLTDEAQAILKMANISLPETKIAKTKEEAVQFAAKIGLPVVMKIVSKDIIHKSEAGGVKVNLKTLEEVADAFDSILASCKKYKANAEITGIEVTEMAETGLQVIIGAKKDAAFGSVIMFGLGGIFVEVFKDVVFEALPISKSEANKMIMSIKANAILKGVRGEKHKDTDVLADVILKVGQILRRCNYISDIEINPLFVYDKGHGAKAVDIRILLEK